MTHSELDKKFFDAAYEEVQQGLSEGGIPIGSALFRNGEMLASVDIVDVHEARCEHMMAEFIDKNPKLWNEDIGE